MWDYWPFMLLALGLALLGLAALTSRGTNPTNPEHDFGEPHGPADSIDATAAAIAAYHQVEVEQAADEEVKWFWKANYQIFAFYEGGGQFQNEGVFVQRNCTRTSFIAAWNEHCVQLTARLGSSGGKLLSVAITGYISAPSDEFADLSYTYPEAQQ
jgi:hypothetical protein